MRPFRRFFCVVLLSAFVGSMSFGAEPFYQFVVGSGGASATVGVSTGYGPLFGVPVYVAPTYNHHHHHGPPPPPPRKYKKYKKHHHDCYKYDKHAYKHYKKHGKKHHHHDDDDDDD